MVETINPAVCGTRARFMKSLAAYFVGSAIGGGLVIAAVASFVLVAGVLPWIALTIFAIGLAVVKDAGIRVPVPYRRRQVPEWLRDIVPMPVTGFVFGFELGIGFLTHFTSSAHLTVVLLAGWMATQSPAAGMSIVLAQAAAKTLVLLITPRSATQDEIEALIEWDPRAIRRMGASTGACSTIVSWAFLTGQGLLVF